MSKLFQKAKSTINEQKTIKLLDIANCIDERLEGNHEIG